MKKSDNQNTEQLILEVAEKLFLEKGFSLTSTTEIARVVGCNQALIHYYYRSKERLFTAIFEKKLLLFISELTEYTREKVPFEEKIKILVERHFDMLKKNPHLPFFILTELLYNNDRLTILIESLKNTQPGIYRILQSDLDNEISKGTIRKTTLADLMITIVSMNVMLFVGSPIIKVAIAENEKDYNDFIEHRRKENVRIILLSLKP